MDNKIGCPIRDPNTVLGNDIDGIEQHLVNYSSVPSLLKSSLLSVVSHLWQVKGLGELYAAHKKHMTFGFDEDWCEEENLVHKHFQIAKKQVSERLAGLGLPEELRREAEEVIMPVGIQLLEWLQSDVCVSDGIKYVGLVCWTAQCTIHEKRTAVAIFDKHSSDNIIEQFKVAANVCAEEHIIKSWQKMSAETKRQLISSIECEIFSNHLVAYWVLFCNGDLRKLTSVIMAENGFDGFCEVYDPSHSLYKNTCGLCVYTGKASATEYFWLKLTDEEKSEHVMVWIEWALKNQDIDYSTIDNYTVILCFLLSNLQNVEQVNKVYKKYGKEILMGAVRKWPLQRFILPTLLLIQDNISEQFYRELILALLYVRPNAEGDVILDEVFSRSPTHLQISFWKHLMKPFNFWHVFSQCLYDKRKEPFRIIFRNIHPLMAKKMAFNLAKYEGLCNYIKDGSLTMLDVVFNEILSSESDVKAAKKSIAVHQGSILCVDWAEQENWEKIDSFFSWCFSSRAEFDAFKQKGLRKLYVGACLINEVGLEALDSFVKWCFKSQEEINKFKRRFALIQGASLTHVLSHQGWREFMKFLRWAFKTSAGVRTFKVVLRARRWVYETDMNKSFIRKLKLWLSY